MKNIFAAWFVAIALSACELPPVPIPVEGETLVESNPLVVTLNSLGFEQFTNFDLASTAAFKNEVGSLNKVKAIYLDQFTLAVVAPADASIDFIHAGTFSFAADGKIEQLVAEIPSRPADGAKTIELHTFDQTNLKDIIASEQFTLTSNLDVTSPDQDTTVRARLVFMIHLN